MTILSRPFAHTGAIVTAALCVGCAQPSVIYRPAAAAVENERAPLAILTRNGNRIVVRNAHVERDTLFARQADAPMDASLDVQIAISDVVSITRDERSLNGIGAGATGLAIGALLGALLLLGLAVGLSV